MYLIYYQWKVIAGVLFLNTNICWVVDGLCSAKIKTMDLQFYLCYSKFIATFPFENLLTWLYVLGLYYRNGSIRGRLQCSEFTNFRIIVLRMTRSKRGNTKFLRFKDEETASKITFTENNTIFGNAIPSYVLVNFTFHI